MRLVVVASVAALVVSACAESDTSATTTTAAADYLTTTSHVTTTVPAPAVDTPQVVKEAIADLSERLAVVDTEITVSSFDEVTWIDGSIGCPIEGNLYTQAIEDGALVVLEHGGSEYFYHQKRGDDPFLCDLPGSDKYIKPRAEP